MVGTMDKKIDKSDPEYYEPMPIVAMNKPLTSYVNGKPFKDYKVPKESQRGTPYVDIPKDKAPLDPRDPEAVAVLDKMIAENKLSPLERKLKKKEEKRQKDYEKK